MKVYRVDLFYKAAGKNCPLVLWPMEYDTMAEVDVALGMAMGFYIKTAFKDATHNDFGFTLTELERPNVQA